MPQMGSSSPAHIVEQAELLVRENDAICVAMFPGGIVSRFLIPAHRLRTMPVEAPAKKKPAKKAKKHERKRV